MLGGDRALNPQYGAFDTAIELHPEHFTKLPTSGEVLACPHEMALIELLSASLKLPQVSVFAQGNNGRRADTKDTIIALLEQQGDWLSTEKPLLFIGRWAHILRQGIQAQSLMPAYTIDIASRLRNNS